MNFRFFLLYASLFFVIFSSCTKNDDTTLIPMGEEFYFKDIDDIAPPDVVEFIDGELSNYIASAQIVTSGGWYPINIEGNYRLDPRENILFGTGIAGSFYEITLNNQHNGIVEFEMKYDSLVQLQGYFQRTNILYSADTAYVRSKGDDITIYAVCNMDFNLERTGQDPISGNFMSLIMIFGKMTEIGIKDIHVFEHVNDVLSCEPENLFDFFKDQMIVYKAGGDGIARRINVNEE